MITGLSLSSEEQVHHMSLYLDIYLLPCASKEDCNVWCQCSTFKSLNDIPC